MGLPPYPPPPSRLRRATSPWRGRTQEQFLPRFSGGGEPPGVAGWWRGAFPQAASATRMSRITASSSFNTGVGIRSVSIPRAARSSG
jgi:hypothetical protein